MQDELVEFLKQDTGQFRVLDTSGYLRHSVAARHNIELATGYNPLILKEYVELANLISGDEEYAPTELMLQLDPKFSLEKIKNHEVIDLLNVKYVVSHTKSNVSGYKLVYENLEYEQVRHYGGKEFVMETNKVFVYENVDVLPRVFVSDYKSGVVEITKYSPNQIMLNAELKEQDFVVLSEVYYPGWKAYDNGKPIDIQKTNQALRGIQLEKGDHVIDFVYEPISYRIGKVISILSVLVLLVILFKLNKKNIFYRFL